MRRREPERDGRRRAHRTRPPSGRRAGWTDENRTASLTGDCRHEGPLLIEPEEDGEEAYRAVCLICLVSGPPRENPRDALEALLEREQEEEG
ncbi:MAG: hypothetical protein M3Q60_11555 [Actinomycetota bacterium]|jgi:hypothetical protein|nr:hypothetical protein [Actinomycetota bacterium]